MTDPVDPTPHPRPLTRKPTGHVQDRETEPPAGSGTGSSGGYGVGSDRSSGGSGEPTADGDDRASTAADQTDWLRRADGGPTSS